MLRKRTLIVGIILTFLLTLLYLTYQSSMTLRNMFDMFEFKTVDLRYQLRGEIKKDFEVVIIGIDEKSLNEIGKWPWRRDVHADLVKKLKDLGVKSIGFDVSFTEDAVPKYLTEYKANLKTQVLKYYRENKIDKEAALTIATEINKLDLSEDLTFAKAIKDVGKVVIGTYNIIEKEENITEEVLNNNTYMKYMYNNFGEGLIEQIYEVQRVGERSFQPHRIYKII